VTSEPLTSATHARAGLGQTWCMIGNGARKISTDDSKVLVGERHAAESGVCDGELRVS